MTDHHDALNRYLDDLANGQTVYTSTIEPELVDTIHRMAEIGSTPLPDPTFIDQLEDTLMNALATAAAVPRPGRPSPFALPTPGRPAVTVAIPTRWFAILASAALVLLTLGIAGYATLDRDGSPGPGAPAVVAPATPSPSSSADGVLLEFPLSADAVPDDGFGAAGIRFYTMAPGTVAAWNGEMSALNPGIWANYVLEGSMTMVADGTVELVRANGTRESAVAGTEIVLAAGDAVIHRAEESAEWTSLGSAEVQIVSLVVLSDNAIIYPQPDFWHATGYDVDGPAPIPAGDWVVRLEELQLEPDRAIPAPESPSTQYGVTRADPLAYLAKGMGGQLTLRLAKAPTTVYVFTLEWLGESATTPAP